MSLTQSQKQVYKNLEVRIGDYVRYSKKLISLQEKISPDALLTDFSYQRTLKEVNNAKQRILDISPTALNLYSVDSLPDQAHKITNLMTPCITEDILHNKFSESEDLKPLDNLITTIGIPKFKKQDDGTMLIREFLDDDGNPVKVAELDGGKLEQVAVLNGKPEDVVNTLKQIFSSLKNSEINSDNTFEEDDEFLAKEETFTKQEVQDMLEEFKTSMKSDFDQKVLEVVASPAGQQKSKEVMSEAYYNQIYNQYLDDFKSLHFDLKTGQPITQVGNNLLQQVSYQQNNADGSTSPVKGTLLQALEIYINKELSSSFVRYNTDNKGLLFTNISGTDTRLNELFIEFIMNAITTASSRLIGENYNLPKELFDINQKPANPFSQKQASDQSLFQRFQQPGVLHGTLEGDSYNSANQLTYNRQNNQQANYYNQQSNNNLLAIATNPALQSAPGNTPIYQPVPPSTLIDDARASVNKLVPNSNNEFLPLETSELLSFN